MVPFYAVLLVILAAIIIGMVLGVVVRCAQEKYHFESYIIALMAIPIQLVLNIVFPFISPFMVFKSDYFKKMFFLRRLIWSFVAIFVSIVYVVGAFRDIMERSFWQPLSEANELIGQIHQAKSLSIVHFLQSDVKKSFDRSFNIVNERVSGMALAR